jgi:guanylate kinase
MKRRLADLVPVSQFACVIGKEKFLFSSVVHYKNLIFSVSAESGTGKTTFIKKFINTLHPGSLTCL